MIDGTAYISRPLTFDYNKNLCLMPILSYDFNTLPQFIPDKELIRFFYSDDSVSVTPIDWYLAYLHILLTLNIVWFKAFSFATFYFKPVSEWAAVLDTYTFSREFLEYLLEDLTKEEQTEGTLLVIKKLAEMGEENNAERYNL